MLSDNIGRTPEGVLTIAGQEVTRLAAEYGTPLYLMDEQRIRSNCRMYLKAFRENFPEDSLPLYASKAASFKQIYRIMAEEGMGVDVVSSGELYTALAAGFPAERIHFHGNCKTDADIAYGVASGIGCFIADNREELLALEKTAAGAGVTQAILLRVTPGIDPHTYEAVSTGKVDSKFGAAVETGQAMELVKLALAQPHLKLLGLHCHVGSQVFGEDVYQRTIDIMAAFLAEIRDETGAVLEELNLGGGYGVRYTEEDEAIDIPARLREVALHLRRETEKHGLPMPRFLMEPGRSIVADAGMTLYTVGSIKRIPGYKQYAAVDGGMTDNPRYALYQSRYTVYHGSKTGPTERFDVVGRCCESGDIIQPHVELPADTCRGDILAVCTTGAYNYSMASNYNRLPRPPIVMLTPEGSYTAVRRETFADLTALDE
ncbi:diaminopimelate decarboxylase [Neopoerus faecalis]|uniref:diaminopimelate decarboxylase n=1 Tax=Neopoerus faecalis TaxID=3032125 RepID=UPI002570E65F|nr:diaminopimelate decarboxylase [Neopoerus faecalis]